MSRYLGLDLGANSVGWAYIDLNRTEKRALRRKYQREIFLDSKFSKKMILMFKIKNFIKINIRISILSGITFTMFVLSLIFIESWQLFFNIGIGGIISILTLDVKKVNINCFSKLESKSLL